MFHIKLINGHWSAVLSARILDCASHERYKEGKEALNHYNTSLLLL